jgi:hypothetical protein
MTEGASTPGPEALLVEKMCDAYFAAQDVDAPIPPYACMWEAYLIAQAYIYEDAAKIAEQYKFNDPTRGEYEKHRDNVCSSIAASIRYRKK